MMPDHHGVVKRIDLRGGYHPGVDHGLILPSLGDDATRESIDAAAEITERLGFTDAWTTDHVLMGAGAAEGYGRISEAVTTLALIGEFCG